MARNNRLERNKVRTQKEVRSKASLYKLSDPHKFDERDEWGDINPGSPDNYKVDSPKRNRRNGR